MRIPLIKSHASSNDVFVVPWPYRQMDRTWLSEVAKRLCDRRGVFGADGVYFVDPRTHDSQFVNPDGSFAEICGNGLRCVARALIQRDQPCVTIHTPQELKALRLAEDVYRVELPEPIDVDEHVVFNESTVYSLLKCPNPHLVAFCDDLSEGAIELTSRIAEAEERFAEGVNVSHVRRLGDGEFAIRTCERGAGFTQSCGSAQVAAYAALEREAQIESNQSVLFRSLGGPSRVGRESGTIYLEGNATRVFTVDLDPEELLGEQPLTRIVLDFDDVSAFRFAEVHEQNRLALARVGIL